MDHLELLWTSSKVIDSKKKAIKFMGIILFFAASMTGLAVWQLVNKPHILFWDQLEAYDLMAQKSSRELTELNGELVQMSGYVVPFDDESKEFSAFLLVPDFLACIHLPLPPPNQVIKVIMKKEIQRQRSVEPVVLQGRFKIESKLDATYGTPFVLENVKLIK